MGLLVLRFLPSAGVYPLLDVAFAAIVAMVAVSHSSRPRYLTPVPRGR